MKDYQIEKLDFLEPADMQKLVDLQNIVYAGRHIFDSDSFKHWYLDNPSGKVVSYNALYNDILAAHYAIVPIKMNIEGRVALGLLSMATVTHPEHRGRGLFKTLAKKSYEYAAQQGFEFVIGVANANSFPGFVKYFDFQDVGMLDVMFGFNTKIKESSNKAYKFFWDKDTIKWRLGNNLYLKDSYAVYGTHPVWKFKAAPFIHTYLGELPADLLDELNIPNVNHFLRPINLYIGMGSNAKDLGYFTIPKFLRHSPFHLIFLDLTGGKLPKMTRDNIFFQLMDFDVA